MEIDYDQVGHTQIDRHCSTTSVICTHITHYTLKNASSQILAKRPDSKDSIFAWHQDMVGVVLRASIISS